MQRPRHLRQDRLCPYAQKKAGGGNAGFSQGYRRGSITAGALWEEVLAAIGSIMDEPEDGSRHAFRANVSVG